MRLYPVIHDCCVLLWILEAKLQLSFISSSIRFIQSIQCWRWIPVLYWIGLLFWCGYFRLDLQFNFEEILVQSTPHLFEHSPHQSSFIQDKNFTALHKSLHTICIKTIPIPIHPHVLLLVVEVLFFIKMSMTFVDILVKNYTSTTKNMLKKGENRHLTLALQNAEPYLKPYNCNVYHLVNILEYKLFFIPRLHKLNLSITRMGHDIP